MRQNQRSGTANVKATFSDPARNVNVNFKLYPNGPGASVGAVVTPAGTNYGQWVLNPNTALEAGRLYAAKALPGVTDDAGNRLDQNPAAAGDQPMGWSFRTRN